MHTRFTLTAFLFCSLVPGYLHAQAFTVQVGAGNYLRAFSLVEVPLPPQAMGHTQWTATNLYNRRIARVQASADGTSLLMLLPDTIRVNGIAYYRLVPSGTAAADDVGPLIAENDSAILFTLRGRELMRYHTQPALRAGLRPVYRRSGFIHPLRSPGGQILTDDFPMGHPHQHGLFAAWVRTQFRGDAVDFWNQQEGTGTVEHVVTEAVENGPLFSRVRTLLRYLSTKHGPVLHETWTITVFDYPQHHLFDIEVQQQNITSDTLFIQSYHYGGMAFRGNAEWNPDDRENYRGPWRLRTNQGLRDSLANGSRAHWVSISGSVQNKPAGLTVFGYPSNFRAPQPVRVHPTMPYWCFAPAQQGEFFLAPGAIQTNRYRYFVHDGWPDTDWIMRIWQDLRYPLLVDIMP